MQKRGVLSLEDGVEFPAGFLLHCRQDVRVDVHRHADLAMAQQFLHHFGMDADAQKHGG